MFIAFRSTGSYLEQSVIRSEDEIVKFKIFIQCQLSTLKTNQQILNLSLVFLLLHIFTTLLYNNN